MKEKKESLWYRLWDHKSEDEKKRLRSFIPLTLYGVAVIYGVLYLSILNTVNRDNLGPTVKSWWGGDQEIPEKERIEKEIAESYKSLRKSVPGGR